MGIFGSHEEKLENKAQQYRNDGMFQYQDTVCASLAPKDGKVHVVYTWRRQRIKYAALEL